MEPEEQLQQIWGLLAILENAEDSVHKYTQRFLDWPALNEPIMVHMEPKAIEQLWELEALVRKAAVTVYQAVKEYKKRVDGMRKCPKCKGSGKEYETTSQMSAGYITETKFCSMCDGTGWIRNTLEPDDA